MATTIEIEFEDDLSDEELKGISEKINKVLNGEGVPEAEVVGQRSPKPPPRIRRVPPRTPRI